MDSRLKARLIGFMMFAIGAGGTGYLWYSVLTKGVYWEKASFLFPFFAFLGISVILFPFSKEESLALYGTEQIPWKHIPVGQKVLVGLGVLAGIAQWAFFSGKI